MNILPIPIQFVSLCHPQADLCFAVWGREPIDSRYACAYFPCGAPDGIGRTRSMAVNHRIGALKTEEAPSEKEAA